MQKEIYTPHDKFFKHAMSDIRVAQNFFQHHLPPAIQKIVNLDTLQLNPGSFVDEQLQTSLTDMLFSVEFEGQASYLYLLAEHQSSVDQWMAFRLLKYIVRILEQHTKGHPDDNQLPVVYPIVFYHGQDSYTGTTDLLDLFADRNLAEQFFLKPFQLVDVNQIPDEELRQYVWSGVMELCLKHIFVRDILVFIRGCLEPLKRLIQAGGQEVAKTALTYVVAAGQVSNPQDFVKTMSEGLDSERGETIMATVAQYLEAKGIEKGRQEGREKGKKEAEQTIALRLLEKGLSIEAVSQITDLPMIEVRKLATKIEAH